MFKTLYELLTGPNANPAYRTDVFPTVGLFTLVVSLLTVVLFYLLLGRWKPVWHKLGHWLITMVLLAGFAGYFAIATAKAATEEEADSYMYTFALFNILFAIVYFIVFSLLLKKTSIFAKRTPF